MSEIISKLRAKLVSIEDRHVLILDANVSPIWVHFALVERGTEELILPDSLLDDWGGEIKSMALYRWIRQNGQHFPRAEIFGSRPDGEHVQRFLREIDLSAKFPCFARKKREDPLDLLRKIDFVLTKNESNSRVNRIEPPDHIPYPLSEVDAEWWLIPATDKTMIEEVLSHIVNYDL